MAEITVGLFNDAYLPVIDGVTMVVHNYASLISKRHGKCFVVAPASPGYKETDEFEVVRFNSIPLPGKSPYRACLPILDPKFTGRMKALNADIIHSHAPFGSGISGLITAKTNKIPMVATFHSKYYDDFKQAFHSDLLAELGVDAILRFYNKADSVWAVNKSTAGTLKDYGFKGDIEIMPNGTEFVPPSDISFACSQVNSTLNIGPEEKLLLFVGRLVWHKNIETLARSVLILKNAGLQFKIAIAGSGDADKAFSELVCKLGIEDRTILLGSVTDRDFLKHLYARANLFVFPSLYDNAPIVIKEAAACSCPSIVVKDSNSSEGITDGFNGFLFHNSPESLAGKIFEVIGNGQLLKQVGENASKTLYVTWDTIIEKVFTRYNELIQNKKKQNRRTLISDFKTESMSDGR